MIQTLRTKNIEVLIPTNMPPEFLTEGFELKLDNIRPLKNLNLVF
jgi:hypothetical protein